jgi:hypothetical protein
MVVFHLSGVNVLIFVNHLCGNQLTIKVIFIIARKLIIEITAIYFV